MARRKNLDSGNAPEAPDAPEAIALPPIAPRPAPADGPADGPASNLFGDAIGRRAAGAPLEFASLAKRRVERARAKAARTAGGGPAHASLPPVPLDELEALTPRQRLARVTEEKRRRQTAGRKPAGRPKVVRAAPKTAEDLDPKAAARARARAVIRDRQDRVRGLAETALLDAGIIPAAPDGKSRWAGSQVGFAPTPEDRARVQTLAGLGTPQEQIALMVIHPATRLPISVATLKSGFSRELEQGPVISNSRVAQALFKRAADGASDTAAIFWLKTRAGWRERSVVEVEIKSGVLVPPPTVSPDDWIADQVGRNAALAEPAQDVEVLQ